MLPGQAQSAGSGVFATTHWSGVLQAGGGKSSISLDALTAEERYSLEPVSSEPPERAYDEHWALTLLDQAMKRLREEFVGAGKAAQFERLKTYLSSEAGAGGYGDVAAA